MAELLEHSTSGGKYLLTTDDAEVLEQAIKEHVALTTAQGATGGGFRIFVQDEEPEGATEGDIWIKTGD